LAFIQRRTLRRRIQRLQVRRAVRLRQRARQRLSGTYDTGAAHPRGLADTSCYPRLVAELLDRGWPESDIALLTWGNVQRVLRNADFTARAAQSRREPSTAKISELDS
ncbi:membrane dipeptidase, partial [Streptomyces sp. NPDC005568]|uniref:membrane dipeptidase n=1 Tax=Streptomyces sp. NPDC005568 TaxID=3156887 RepID=UPI0033B4F563